MPTLSVRQPTAATHYHTMLQGLPDFTISFDRFGSALSRCAVLMMEDGEIRKPYHCAGEPPCDAIEKEKVYGCH